MCSFGLVKCMVSNNLCKCERDLQMQAAEALSKSGEEHELASFVHGYSKGVRENLKRIRKELRALNMHPEEIKSVMNSLCRSGSG